eukprot:Em0010g1048a
MAVAFGHIREFELGTESISAYLERVQLYFVANDVANEKKVAVLLSVIGSKTYVLLRSLLHPEAPKEKTFDQLAKTLKEHLEPKPQTIVERFHFHRRNQEQSESVLDYIAELRRLSATCDFGGYLNEVLRDRFVCGLSNEATQKRLLTEQNLDLAKALGVAQAMEAAQKNALQFKDLSVGRVKLDPKGSQVAEKQVTPCRNACYRCGKNNHVANKCKFIDATCHCCGKTGHIASVCRRKQKNERRGGSKLRWVENESQTETEEGDEDRTREEDDRTEGICTLSEPSGRKPMLAEFKIQGVCLTMEIDTGAAVTLISLVTFNRHFPKMTLSPSSARLSTYTGQKISVCGEIKVKVRYGQQVRVCTLIVVEGDGPNLVGRGWLRSFKLDWHRIQKVQVSDSLNRGLDTLLTRFVEVFEKNEESQKLCTLNTHRGLYQYRRMPFGIASAPALFQKTMDSVLQGIKHVVCYIDDILVTGSNEIEHLRNLEQVFNRLKERGIRLRKDKCVFHSHSVDFLGHRIDAEGIHPLPSKVEAMVKAPAPRNITELKSFLGMVNYYAKFLPNVSTHLFPLYALLKKEHGWKWDKECQHAFVLIKKMLSSTQVLTPYDPKLPLRLAADASAYGLGAVLSHEWPDGSERPIAFASRTLASAERHYAQLEKEALALIFGIKKFHQYLYGRKFTLVTDHKPLTTILGPKKGIPVVAASRLQRWAMLLAAYTYDIQYRSTHENGNADGLSRLPLQEDRPDVEGPINGKMFILLVDAHSKWPEVFEMPNTTSQKTIEILRQVFSAYGLPEQLVSDNGPQFISREFAEFMAKNGIKHIRSAPYHPATNGQVERFVQTFKRAMKTGTTKREVRTRLHLLRETTEQQVCKKQAEQKWHHDKKARDRECAERETVLSRNYGSDPKWVRGRIGKQCGPVSYQVELPDGRVWRRHIEQLSTVPEAVCVPVPTTKVDGRAPDMTEPDEVAEETRPREELMRQPEITSTDLDIQDSNPTASNEQRGVRRNEGQSTEGKAPHDHRPITTKTTTTTTTTTTPSTTRRYPERTRRPPDRF